MREKKWLEKEQKRNKRTKKHIQHKTVSTRNKWANDSLLCVFFFLLQLHPNANGILNSNKNECRTKRKLKLIKKLTNNWSIKWTIYAIVCVRLCNTLYVLFCVTLFSLAISFFLWQWAHSNLKLKTNHKSLRSAWK